MSQLIRKDSGGSLVGVVKALVPNAGDTVTPNAFNEINLLGGNNITTTGTLVNNTVTIDLTGTTDHAVQIGNATGSLDSLAVGTDGMVLLGATAADPAFATLTSTDGSVVFTPGANTLNLEAASSVATSFPTDAGTATPAVHALTVAGGTNINSAGAGSTVTLNLDPALTGMDSVTFNTGGELLTGINDGNTFVLRAYDTDGVFYKTFATLTANATPSMDLDTDVTINSSYIYRAGGGDVIVADGGTGVSTLTTHGILMGNGVTDIQATAEPTDGQILIGKTGDFPQLATLTAGANVTITEAAGSITIASASGLPAGGLTGEGLMAVTGSAAVWDSSPTYTGLVTGTGLTASAGDVTVSGNVLLPTTTSTTGQLQINSTRFLHNYGTENTFVGSGAGNFTLASATGQNTCLGYGTLAALTSGHTNAAFGAYAGTAITSGTWNNCIGRAAGYSITTGTGNNFQGYTAGVNITTGVNNTAIGMEVLLPSTSASYNTAIGWRAGLSNSGANSSNIYIMNAGANESNKMRLGTTGTGNGQVNATYIAGIYGVTPGGTKNMCIVDSNGQMGSAALPTGGGLTWTAATANTTMVADNGYITLHATPATKLEYTLPASCAVGKVLRIAGQTAGGWKVIQAANQYINFGDTATTTGVAGYLEFTDAGDCIEMVCIVADLGFRVVSSIGNITVA